MNPLRPRLARVVRIFLAALLAAAPVARAAGAPEPRLEGGDIVVRRAGPDAELAVWVEGAEGVPPVAGAVVAGDDGGLRFRPRFPLSPGQAYRVTVGGEAVGRLTVPLEAGAPARVEAVYPSGDHLPENLLKFYLHFSRPMGRGYAYDQVRLRDVAGEAIERPFLEIGEELWNPEGTRLTLFLDPGRVKRGLTPHEEDGPVLEAGKHYTLEISSDWKDARGQPLEAGFTKTFRTVGADREQPDPARWELAPPTEGTVEPLRVTFSEPLDHALAERVVGVAAIEGQARVLEGERVWHFVPDRPWRAQSYVLEVGTELEDVAGNSVRKAFEVEAGGGAGSALPLGSRIEIPFVVGGASAGP